VERFLGLYLHPLDGPRQRVFSLALLVPQPRVYEHRVTLPAGRHTFSAAFVNDFADPENANPNLRKRNLFLQSLEVADLSSPPVIPPVPAPLAALVARHPSADATAARAILADFTRRAWRRPATAPVPASAPKTVAKPQIETSQIVTASANEAPATPPAPAEAPAARPAQAEAQQQRPARHGGRPAVSRASNKDESFAEGDYVV
jgi:hypothetical protein